jgi:hypothetical protein
MNAASYSKCCLGGTRTRWYCAPSNSENSPRRPSIVLSTRSRPNGDLARADEERSMPEMKHFQIGGYTIAGAPVRALAMPCRQVRP